MIEIEKIVGLTLTEQGDGTKHLILIANNFHSATRIRNLFEPNTPYLVFYAKKDEYFDLWITLDGQKAIEYSGDASAFTQNVMNAIYDHKVPLMWVGYMDNFKAIIQGGPLPIRYEE